jgi:hypothetical protein
MRWRINMIKRRRRRSMDLLTVEAHTVVQVMVEGLLVACILAMVEALMADRVMAIRSIRSIGREVHMAVEAVRVREATVIK